MNLASSSYSYEPKSSALGQAKTDGELRDHIERMQGEFPGYGYRRLEEYEMSIQQTKIADRAPLNSR
jgi:hypothetical protein